MGEDEGRKRGHGPKYKRKRLVQSLDPLAANSRPSVFSPRRR
jgi:hypothetical protein